MSEEPAKYESNSQQRILLVLVKLAGHELNGITPGELAEACASKPSQVTKDLANLHQAGLAEKMPDSKRWRLAPRIVQIAIQHMRAIEHAAAKLAETKQRYSRDPN